MTVAILGTADDPQVQAVQRKLNAQDVESVVWDADNWPGEMALSFDVGGDVSLTVDDAVDVESLTSVYLRRMSLDPRGPEFEGELEERAYSMINQLREYRGLVLSVLQYLESNDVPVVNPPSTLSTHSMKPFQIAAFEDADIPVPETLATNDPDAVGEFVERVGDVIYKPVAGGGHARKLTRETITDEHMGRLANAPVQFQAFLDGTNYRLFVVDGEVVATGRIETDELDYRLGDHEVVADTVSDAVETAAVRAAERLDLRFSGVDVVITDDGFGVLEANPSPMFAVFDERAGTDVAGHLAAYLGR